MIFGRLNSGIKNRIYFAKMFTPISLKGAFASSVLTLKNTHKRVQTTISTNLQNFPLPRILR